MKNQTAIALLLIVALPSVASASVGLPTVQTAPPMELKMVGHKMVWDKAPHNAFTDLIRFKGKWFLALREASSHMTLPAPSGDIRILSSEDGENWKSAALIKYGTDLDDLRDPKLSVTPQGRLLMVCALDNYFPKKKCDSYQSFAYTSDDGIAWEGPHKIGESNLWMWRVVWSPEGTAYGLAYDCKPKNRKWTTRLYRSKDGLRYDTFLPRFTPQDRVNEASMIFREDGSAVALVRRDGEGPDGAIVGIAKGDYSDWTFKELKQRIGGPHIIEVPGGHIFAAGRLYDGGARTSVGLLNPEAGVFTELLKLPSGGDNSYPGMVFHNGLLWVSYYSSHEGKAKIYLAKIKVKPAKK